LKKAYTIANKINRMTILTIASVLINPTRCDVGHWYVKPRNSLEKFLWTVIEM